MTEQQINELGAYLGSDPCPPDFDAFWAERMAEADAVPLQWELQPADEEPLEGPCTCYDLWFSGMGGARLYAKYLRPAVSCPPVLLQFHGYPGASRSWFEQASFPALGYALIAMDNPGQGGRSQDTGGFLGTTVAGHLVAGAEGEPRDLYYVRLYQDVRILCRIVEELGKRGELDLGHVYVNGASQGGGMGVACCALNPQLVNRAAILYPFLSDFRKVSELDADEVAYEGLRYWSRWFDPDGTRADELFGRLAYFDTKNFAHLVRCPVFFGTGLDDVVCPPPTQCATYNQLGGPHERLLYPGFGHEEIQDFDDAAVLFFGAGDRGEGLGFPAAGPVDVAALNAAHDSLVYEQLELPGPRGTIAARSLRPAGEGPWPTMLLFHDVGRPGRGWHHLARYVALGCAVVQMENHAAVAADAHDPAFDDALACARAIVGLPWADPSRLMAFGEGFGGALALWVAAHERLACAAAVNAYPLDRLLPIAGRIDCPVLLGTACMDELASVPDQDALAASLPQAEQRHYPKYVHERINAFENALMAFLNERGVC